MKTIFCFLLLTFSLHSSAAAYDYTCGALAYDKLVNKDFYLRTNNVFKSPNQYLNHIKDETFKKLPIDITKHFYNKSVSDGNVNAYTDSLALYFRLIAYSKIANEQIMQYSIESGGLDAYILNLCSSENIESRDSIEEIFRAHLFNSMSLNNF